MRAVMVVNTGAPTTTVAEGLAGLGAGVCAGEVRRFLAGVLTLTRAVFLLFRDMPRAAVGLVGLALALALDLGAEGRDLATFLIFFMA